MARSECLSTNEVCEFFDISKSALFRWEKEGLIGQVDRSDGDQRKYCKKNMEEIIKIKFQKRCKRLKEISGKMNALEFEDKFYTWMQDKSVAKIISGNFMGVRELIELGQPINSSNTKKLMKYALEKYEPDEFRFQSILSIVAKNYSPFPNSINSRDENLS
jgi:DNA-binding transcriptional MerR regulator